MSSKDGGMFPTEKGPKSQLNLRSRPANADSQDGGTCEYSLRLTRSVSECFGKVLDEKLSTLSNVLEAVSLRVEDNTKRITEMERRVSDIGRQCNCDGEQAKRYRKANAEVI